jgi:hypothetical protein
MDEELGNDGQGNSGPEVGSTDSYSVDSQVSGSESTTENSQSESSRNPAWESALSAIPPEFHSHLEKNFSEWDRGVQNRFEKVQQELAPLKAYQEFAELKLNPKDINEAMQIRHILNTQPRDLYEYLAKQHNFGQESQGQQNAETPDYDLSNEEYDLEKDPRFLAVKQQAEFAQSAIQENQRIQTEAKIQAEIDAEVKSIQSNPAFNGLNIQDIATFAQGLPNANQKGSLIAAAEKLAAYLPKERVSDSAPPVLSGNRGLPAQPTNYGKMTGEERARLVADYMKAQDAV